MCNHAHVIVIVIKIIDFTGNHNCNHLKKAWCNHNHNHAAVIGPNPGMYVCMLVGMPQVEAWTIASQLALIVKLASK